MHRADGRRPILTLVQFGFDRERLYVRVDATRPMADLLADGHEVSLKFLIPEGVRFSVTQTQGRLAAAFWDRQWGRWRTNSRGANGVRRRPRWPPAPSSNCRCRRAS